MKAVTCEQRVLRPTSVFPLLCSQTGVLQHRHDRMMAIDILNNTSGLRAAARVGAGALRRHVTTSPRRHHALPPAHATNQ
ncbi:hypothetical protein RR46_03015 [Papilio xuthus]|uniref:Uncharacterized protein n=1 Tax=Papilio xuthus TaxID=66420 RepID=A0A194Q3W1_PAPXU|nr:hypothetical protein RR46_03015 [Papilio xuthus]